MSGVQFALEIIHLNTSIGGWGVMIARKRLSKARPSVIVEAEEEVFYLASNKEHPNLEK